MASLAELRPLVPPDAIYAEIYAEVINWALEAVGGDAVGGSRSDVVTP